MQVSSDFYPLSPSQPSFISNSKSKFLSMVHRSVRTNDAAYLTSVISCPSLIDTKELEAHRMHHTESFVAWICYCICPEYLPFLLQANEHCTFKTQIKHQIPSANFPHSSLWDWASALPLHSHSLINIPLLACTYMFVLQLLVHLPPYLTRLWTP